MPVTFPSLSSHSFPFLLCTLPMSLSLLLLPAFLLSSFFSGSSSPSAFSLLFPNLSLSAQGSNKTKCLEAYGYCPSTEVWDMHHGYHYSSTIFCWAKEKLQSCTSMHGKHIENVFENQWK